MYCFFFHEVKNYKKCRSAVKTYDDFFFKAPRVSWAPSCHLLGGLWATIFGGFRGSEAHSDRSSSKMCAACGEHTAPAPSRAALDPSERAHLLLAAPRHGSPHLMSATPRHAASAPSLPARVRRPHPASRRRRPATRRRLERRIRSLWTVSSTAAARRGRKQRPRPRRPSGASPRR